MLRLFHFPGKIEGTDLLHIKNTKSPLIVGLISAFKTTTTSTCCKNRTGVHELLCRIDGGGRREGMEEGSD